MTISQRRVNKEIMIILNKFNLCNKIPSEVLHNIENNQDDTWDFVYDNNLKLEEQNILRQTAVMFSTLYIMYICDNSIEKENLKQLYIENEKKNTKNNDFEEFIKNVKGSKEDISELPAVVEENTIIQRIKRWLKSFGNKK